MAQTNTAAQRAKIKAKIEKLLRLAKSAHGTPEGVAARKTAEELMAKHNFKFAPGKTERQEARARRLKRKRTTPDDLKNVVHTVASVLNDFAKFLEDSEVTTATEAEDDAE